ncbi:S-layer homology domain-containing protein [Paenibacillus sp. JDR-2]|uniref:S-layer homology domain-containing protein n=1 Tax=Paenibacillus sp. (strain JDR-2) TaxID=324057 RepID=UPI000166A398|nr:S-layer homology domain-containing protein [Paenibacillus sp. JDR-2]ACT00509.1 S-layer domain protein [Paenibacillus sp. JDR-2]
MTQRKSLVWILSIVMFLSCFIGQVGTASAAKNSTVELLISASNSKVELRVMGHNLDDLYAYDFVVHYNNQKLKFLSTTSSFGGFAVDPLKKDNTVRIARTKVGAVDGLNGDAELATLTFERIASGASEISLTNVQVVNSKLDLKALSDAKTNVPNNVTFSDIKGHWAESAINQAMKLGFVNGYPDNTFKPEREVTRAEFVVMLAKALGLNGAEQKATFKDNIPTWAKPYIETAVNQHIISGYTDGTFRPNNRITREEIAAIAIRALDMNTSNNTKLKFADTKQIAEWAKPYVALSNELGIMQGRGNNNFAPKAAATRAEAVTVILNILKSIEKMQK